MRQMSFPAAMMRSSRLLAKVLLWEAGELPMHPEDVLLACRALRARLIAVEETANQALARARLPLSDARGVELSNGDATTNADDEPPPF